MAAAASLPTIASGAVGAPEDEHEIKLHVEAGGAIARIADRIERLAARADDATLDAIAGDIYRALGLDVSAGISGISRIDRVSVYHDTGALDLHRGNASLRIRRRRSGKYRVNAKTEESPGSPGHAIRREWRYGLAPDAFARLAQVGFLPLVERHFGDLLAPPLDARWCLSPTVRIHKRSTRIGFTGPSGQRYLLSLDRFRGFDCRIAGAERSTRELREIEVEARNRKASRQLAAIRDHVALLPGIAPGRAKYQYLVEELGIEAG
jgi:hypothetical protein